MENIEKTEVITEETKNKKMPWWKKTLLISGSTLGIIVTLCCVFVLVVNTFKWTFYPEYYSIREVLCTNHGMNDNYISQGTAITNDGKYLITSGYMSDKTHSRIYITEIETDQTKYVKLTRNGEPCTYHMGGVAFGNDTVYLSSNRHIFSFPLSDLFEKDIIELGEGTKINNTGSYIFSNDEHLFVGEFWDGVKEVEEKVIYNNKEYCAITKVYRWDDLSAPVSVIAVREKVQGFAVSAAGGILLSTSYGLNNSKFYYYKESSIIDTKTTFRDVPLYVCENHDLLIEGPAMSEDLDYHDGKFITNFESACNKYFYGKLVIGADKIVALDVEKLLPKTN